MPSTVIRRTDAELVDLFVLAQAGDKQAMEDAMAELDSVCRECSRQYRRRTSATLGEEDLLQEARLAAYRSVMIYPAESGIRPRSWVYLDVRKAMWVRTRQDQRRRGDALSLEVKVYENPNSAIGGMADEALTGWQPAAGDLEFLLDRLSHGRPFRDTDQLEKRIAPRGLNTNLPPDSELIKLVRADLTYREIAARYGVSPLAVRHRIKRLRAEWENRPGRHGNLPLRPQLPDDATLVRLVEAGATLPELAERFGVKPKTIVRHLTGLRKKGSPVPKVKVDRRNPNLPPNETLIQLVWQGKTLYEMAEMFGVTPLIVQQTLKKLRKAGVEVPCVRRHYADRQPGSDAHGLAP